MTTTSRIVLCAKSRWDPPLRREHGIATTAAKRGHAVDFVEQPRDVRDLDPRSPRSPAATSPAGVTTHRRFTPVPGHRGPLPAAVEAAGLRRVLRRVLATGPRPSAVVVNTPWSWAGTDGLPTGVRRVLDLGDDWATLLPHRRDRIHACYRRIAAEADAVVVVAPSMVDLFDCEVHVVPNAVAPELLATAPTPAPRGHRMTYVGTLSERFDAALMSAVLDRLPDWRLDLYGPCHYAGAADEPDAVLAGLLSRFGSRVRWHGVVPRARLADVLDAADVLVLPNDPAISVGQDSMKLYDYAARGRPIVATPIRVPGDGPVALSLAAGPDAFAAAVADAGGRDAAPNRAWAEANGWGSRLTPWLSAVEGTRDRVAR